MIRINLLSTERRGGKAPARSYDLAQKMTVLGILLLVLAALGIGWRYWAVGQQAAALDRELAASRREEQRLAEILKQVQQFDARRAQLQHRVGLIDELRKGQTAPVHIIDQISRALPEMTWLTGLKQVGYDVTVEGQCLSLTSLSDFVGNLEASRYFKRPVEILESVVVPGTNGQPDTIRFSVKGTFQMAGIETPARGAPAKKAPAKGGQRG